jgi:putative effector of murein hydrolase LrgA (UPF0299 family)
MAILRSFFVLLLFQLAGEALRTAAHLPIPGPVLGMVLLAAWYIARKREPSPAIQQTADTLLGWLGLLFVPAGVGIIANLALLRAAWLPITVSLVGSTLLTLLVTAWLMQRLGSRSA